MPRLFLVYILYYALLINEIQSQESTLVTINCNDSLIYQKDSKGNRVPDFSFVGYHHSEKEIPSVSIVMTISPMSGDNLQHIQDAIDLVSVMPDSDGDGIIGALLLEAGTYEVSESLFLKSGVVLRGQGNDTSGTILKSTSTVNGSSFIFIGDENLGNVERISETKQDITDDYLPIGSHTFSLEDASGYSVGDRILLRRKPTQAWIEAIGMHNLSDTDSNDTDWTPSSYKIDFRRVITQINENKITIDAPIVDIVDKEKGYATGLVWKYTSTNNATEIGIENMRLESAFSSDEDENHSWSAIHVFNAENCWVRNVKAYYFAYAAVQLDNGSYKITVDNCEMHEPKSQITGGRRYPFAMTRTEQSLIKNCFATKCRHDFATNSRVAGPNVFYNCVGTDSKAITGPHARWATGILYDNVSTTDRIAVENRVNSGTGHGWAGAQNMLWNCQTTEKIVIQSPALEHVNWAIGCIATEGITNEGYDSSEPIGVVESQGEPIANIPSLFMAQLNDRLRNNFFIDTDLDGLSDCEEETNIDDPNTLSIPQGISDPNNTCDNSYITAAEVCAAITNGATGLASSDCDNGGVSDGQECANGTDPLNPSDDNDCPILDDNADCDGDGVTNGQERTDGTDPLDACSMNIASVTLTATSTGDCDGDGVTNADDTNGPDGVVGGGDGTDANDACDFNTSQVTLTATNTGDCDGDGVTNADETNGPDGVVGGGDGTDANDACDFNTSQVTLTATNTGDCDGDGVTNADETNGPDGVVGGGDGTDANDACDFNTSQVTLTATSTGDCDGDGVTNADETNGPDGVVGGGDGTDANDACDFNTSQVTLTATSTGDCDGDGVTNADETNGPDGVVGGGDGTDANDACDFNTSQVTLTATSTGDCDGDGVTNADETNGPDGVVGGGDGTDANDPCDNPYTTAAEVCAAITNGATGLASSDCDNGGVSDGQECANGTDPLNPSDDNDCPIADDNVDCDGDGVTNGQERTDGTDPLDACSMNIASVTLTATNTGDCDGDGVTNADEINGPDGVVGGGDGTDANDACDFNTSQVTLTATNTGDCDGDGVTNADETNGPDGVVGGGDGTDANDACDFNTSQVTLTATNTGDCDGDGVTNADETNGPDGVVGGGDGTDANDACDFNTSQVTLTATSTGDCDGDGVTNADETNGPDGVVGGGDGTDANDPCDNPYTTAAEVCAAITNGATGLASSDCDNGGVSDGQECANGTDPLNPSDDNDCPILDDNADCDGDGVTNGQERTDGTDPLDACVFNRSQVTLAQTGEYLSADCDGDGATNGEEINNGTPTDSPNAADDTTATGPGETVTINILENDDYLPNDANTIEMTGGNAQGTVSFNTTTGTLVYTPTASESGSEVTITYEVCQDNVCTTADVFINVGALAPTCPINTAVFLEGSLIIPGFNSYTNEMRSTINMLGLLPGQIPVKGFAIPTEMGQPYNGHIWGYTGKEGNNFSTYANDVVDWVLVDVRKGESTDGTLADSIDFSNTICRNAGFLHEDGRITFKDDICECPISDGDEVFIVLHHRNHLPIVSELTTVVQSTASFDFRNRQSLSVDFNKGQKKLINNIYAMYGGNGEIAKSQYNDINASDISRWINENSYNDLYTQADYDMNSDVNSNDKLLLLVNAGISSQIVN